MAIKFKVGAVAKLTKAQKDYTVFPIKETRRGIAIYQSKGIGVALPKGTIIKFIDARFCDDGYINTNAYHTAQIISGPKKGINHAVLLSWELFSEEGFVPYCPENVLGNFPKKHKGGA